ncbi:MAG: sensor histidine kinase [Pseudanabaena sp. CRU_2_10]|nr:sensor histidine kinase [Pseudanabaena sp. CRU_2_10]
MNLTLHHRSSSPLRLLLLLEWVLLGVAAIAQILVAVVNPDLGLPLLNGIGLIVFAAMGFISPCRWADKLLYTVSEFVLLILLTFMGEFPLPTLLYIVLVIRNCVLLAGQNTLQGRLRSIVTALAFAICLLSQTYRLWFGRLPLEVPLNRIGLVWIGFSIVFGLVFLFLQLLVDAVLAERKGQEQLAKANAQLRQYALRVEELATEQERNRIARDIHDSLGHSLTVFNIHIAAALRLLHSDPTEAEALLLEVKQLGTQALQEVRQSVKVLRADPFQGRSLFEAISTLIDEFQRATGITPTCTIEIDRPLSDELNFTLYRLVQESLTNICKHAAATEVAIAIQQTSREIQAIVQDNGKGFDLKCDPSGFGLQGMQERILALAGALKIKTAPGQGCHIQAIFPVRSL